MPITIPTELEIRLRRQAEDAGESLDAYLERITRDEDAVEEDLARMALEGLNSGEPIEVGPGYWEEKHRRLEERLKQTAAR